MRNWPRLLAAMLIAVAALRMAATFRVFSATVDEGTHLSAGLEIYEFHQYKVQRENPPPPRVVMALAPYLAGMRFDPNPPWPEQLKTPFYGSGKYERNLVLARVGNLLFFILAATCVWLLARDDLGERGALVAVFLFTMEPVVMGYSSLATHDAAAVAGLVVSLFAFRRWLREPALSRALLFGAAFGFGILCKYSNIVYVPPACIVMTILRLVRDEALRRRFLRAVPAVVPAAIVTLLTIWAGFGFSTGPRNLLTPFQHAFSPRVISWIEHIGPETRIPAPGFFIGNMLLVLDSRAGITSYLCGQTSVSGWWWYFPFAVALKTTLALLALFVVGAFVTKGTARWTWLEWAALALAMIAVAMTSSLDIGVRYLLPAYAAMAIAAAVAVDAMLDRGRLARGVAIALLVVQAGVSLLAHPDYFPYFNLLAGREPSKYLGDSNLDWGQDILRLRGALRARHVGHVYVSTMSLSDYAKLGFPANEPADAYKPVHGWVAISEQVYVMGRLQGGWLWLPSQYERVGKSIRLYQVP